MRIWKKNRQHNDQKKRCKRRNYDLQTIHIHISWHTSYFIYYDTCLMMQNIWHVLRYKIHIYLSHNHILCYILYDTCFMLYILYDTCFMLYIIWHMLYAIYHMTHVLCYISMIPIYWFSAQHIHQNNKSITMWLSLK
jgi:hypothetical protein